MSSLSETLMRAAKPGIKKRAMANEMSNDATTVKAWSPKVCPAMPSMKIIGAKTAMVVRVEATTALPTSLTPRIAACCGSSPSSRQRVIDSSTTIALSTNMPIPRASPPSDMMLRDTPALYMAPKVAIIEIGTAMPMTNVVAKRRRNKKHTKIEKIPPNIAADFTSVIADSMKTDWSLSIANVKSSSRSSVMPRTFLSPSVVPNSLSRTVLATAEMLEPASR